MHLFIYLFKNIYLFILAVPVFVAACGIFVVACGLLSCGMQTLSCDMRSESISLTGDGTWARCIGSAESYPRDHQGSPPPVSALRVPPFWGLQFSYIVPVCLAHLQSC